MKYTLLVSALAIGLCTKAQIGKGRMMIGASFNYNQNKSTKIDSLGITSEQTKSSGFTPALRYGFFVTDHIMVGVYGSYNKAKNETTHSYTPVFGTINETTSNTYTGGLFARYYQMIGKSKFAVFGELHAYYGGGKGTQLNANVSYGVTRPWFNTINYSSFGLGVKPGIVYFLNKTVAIETSFAGVGYSHQNNKMYNGMGKEVSTNSNGSFNSYLNFSLASVALGVNFYFGGNKTAAVKPF